MHTDRLAHTPDAVDRLSHLLQRFDLHARVLHTGRLQGPWQALPGPDLGALLLLQRAGALHWRSGGGAGGSLAQPGAVLAPQAAALSLVAAPGSDWVVAAVDFGGGDENPLLRHLPPVLAVALDDMPTLAPAQQLLFDEAAGARCGHRTVVDRLTEVIVVQLLRDAIQHRRVPAGLFAGLSDPRLARALSAVHADPAGAWSLARMADVAGLSRARFAAVFVQAVGLPPGEYLSQWRLGLAKSLLRRGRPVKQVAAEVGYASASALARAFVQATGAPPTAWRGPGAA